jgi:hypothetical protein
MTDRTDVLRVVSCLLEDLRFLRDNAHTRLRGYSTQFVLDIRREIQAFNAELGQLINRQMQEKTGDLRPFIQDVRK